MFKLKFLLAGFLLAQQSLALWPIPQNMTTGSSNLAVDVSKIVYSVCGSSNSILDRAISRYGNLIAKEKFSPPLDYNIGTLATSGNFQNLEINVDSNSTLLNMETDESYKLDIDASGNASLSSKTVFGAMRGLETFSQLIIYNGGKHIIRDAPISITDKPVFAHRGIMLDTARNFYGIDSIKRTLDAMSYSKLNVFHWHLVDSQAWSVESKFDPQLAIKGAYSPQMTYYHDDVKEILSYAADRGIRVIPEFDMPGHMYIVGQSNPDIMACLLRGPNWASFAAAPPAGQLNIADPRALDFAQKIIKEYAGLFSDELFHVGGDEVSTGCWTMDPKLIATNQNSTAAVASLLSQFYDRVYDTVHSADKVSISWHETITVAKYKSPMNSVIQVWNNQATIESIVNMGYRVIASPSTVYYLDCSHGHWINNTPERVGYYCDPYKTWMNVYSFNPLSNITDPEKRKLVIGSEVGLWSELNDENTLDNMLWPRAAALGEAYWSGQTLPGTNTPRSLSAATPRINEFRFRLVHRGINAEPIQPLWCVRNPGQCEYLPKIRP